MNLKQRFSFVFSCLFSAVLAVSMLVIYILFAQFRLDEFVDRLAEKAETTAKLLLVVKEIDYNMQKIIDKNSITRLYNEKTEVLDDHQKRVYSSTDDIHLPWSQHDLKQVRTNGRFLKKSGPFDMLGIDYVYQQKHYYVLISAEDTYGNRKLVYLKYLLLGTFTTATLLVWLFSFRISKRNLAPFDRFREEIQRINDKNLNTRLPVARREDEINQLAHSFNQMMERIDEAYSSQRAFTSNASHELRTPLARVAAKLENLLTEDFPDAFKTEIRSVAVDVFQLSEVVSSLVILADINNSTGIAARKVRLDELIFNAASEVSATYPTFLLKFEIENLTDKETDLEVVGDETLLRIVMLNLLKNACIYADDCAAECIIIQRHHHIEVVIINTGETPKVSDTAVLFNTLYRGSNTLNKPGSGIGLSIVRRVLQHHGAQVAFQIPDKHTNQVIVTFPLQF